MWHLRFTSKVCHYLCGDKGGRGQGKKWQSVTRGRGSKIGGRPVTFFLNGPSPKTSEIICVRNLKALESFGDLIFLLRYFSNPIPLLLDGNILFLPYFLIVTLLEVQLKEILIEICSKGIQRNLIFSIDAAKSRQKC